MQDNHYQLTATIIVGSLSLIPNNPVRYTALGITACLEVIYAIYFKHPSTLLHKLEEGIDGTGTLIRRAKSQCPRDQISLAGETLQLLQATQATSSIKSRLLDTQRLTWKTYRQFSKDITELTNHVKRIHGAVELIVEAEHQRNLAVEISEAQFILCTVTGCHRAGGIANGYPPSNV